MGGPRLSVVILGAGGHAAVVIDVFRAQGVDVSAATDPDPDRRGSTILGVPIVGSDDELPLLRRTTVRAFVALGDNRARARLIDRVLELGFELATAIHPSAVVSDHAVIGAGSVLMPGAVVNARTTLGRGAIVNTGASVDHDCVLGGAVHIAPGAHVGGSVRCGDRVLIGIGAVVIPGIRIGDDAVVGAGASVIRDVKGGTTVVGVPARARP